ncbi:hypothetical protein EDD85DRAFT_870677 [Armillaria nabsnona]|nr:hypothetical protein EDD85DRAFT_870677 [Armillaria nabsnona]
MDPLFVLPCLSFSTALSRVAQSGRQRKTLGAVNVHRRSEVSDRRLVHLVGGWSYMARGVYVNICKEQRTKRRPERQRTRNKGYRRFGGPLKHS